MRLEDALWQDPERVSGAVCFRGTRIPVSVLFDYLVADGLEEFYVGYPDVQPEQVQAVLAASLAQVENQVKPKIAA